MASLDPVVDLYNAVSIRYAVPVGGENFAAYAGMPQLVVADGTETFDTMKDGKPESESPEAGEVVWRDDTGITCRRWNWRQGVRTRLSVADSSMWFILESLLRAAGSAARSRPDADRRLGKNDAGRALADRSHQQRVVERTVTFTLPARAWPVAF